METKCASRDIMTSVGLSGWRLGSLLWAFLPWNMLLLYSQVRQGNLCGQSGNWGWGGFPGEQIDTEGNLGYKGSLWARETDWAAEATTFTAEVDFENLALLLN